MRRRLEGRGPRPEAVQETPSSLAPRLGLRVLGIDPSLRSTGYGVIRIGRPHPVAVAHGTIKAASGLAKSRCLALIAQTLRGLIQEHQPTFCVMEGLFYAQNLKTALVLGEARGAALAVVGEAGLEIYEMAPRKMKLAIVGYGAAGKPAVARMVQRMLGLDEAPAPDAADALALALAYARDFGSYSLSASKQI